MGRDLLIVPSRGRTHPVMNPSNTELTPLSFLRRSAEVFPEKVAVAHGQRKLTYRELAAQAQQLVR